MNKIIDVLSQLWQTEAHTGKGNLNLIMVFGILLFSKGYHTLLKKALEKNYPLAQLQKHFKPLLSTWLFLGVFVLFVIICAVWLSRATHIVSA
jgi:hypothetical protein